MKILIVTDAWHPQINGVVRTYEHLRDALISMGHEVLITGPSDYPLSIPMPGYQEIRLTLFAKKRVARMIADYRPDILHIGTEGPLGIAAKAYATRNGIRFTTCYHTQFPEYAAKRAAKYFPFLETVVRNRAIAFLKKFHEGAGCIFVATESSRRQLTGWNFIVPIKIMTRGIDHSVFSPGPATLFTDLPRPVALYVGRVAIEKNLQAFLSMGWEGSKVVVGGGPNLAMLSKKFPDAHFTGPKTGAELAEHYRSADIFVFPSKTDTFGMVLIEAMACGLPIAAYPACGPVDIVTNDDLGALDEDLSMAAKKAITCGEQQDRAAYAKANYTWEEAAWQFLELELNNDFIQHNDVIPALCGHPDPRTGRG